jgi:FKBP-type peptidyl-prolyl cis-trans isomerase 2
MINKNDFVEIEFTGRVKEGEIFDTNIKSDGEKIGIQIEEKPFIVCIGHDMLIKGFDKALEGKEIGKEYSIELDSDQAFGPRRKELVKLIPLKLFLEKEVNPKPGMTLALDNMLVKIVSVSGGRVLADFNNPVAGKIVIYDFTIKRKVDEIKEKTTSILEFFLRQKINFEIDEKAKKVFIELDKIFTPALQMLNDQFKEALGYELAIKEPKKENKTEEKKEEIQSN